MLVCAYSDSSNYHTYTRFPNRRMLLVNGVVYIYQYVYSVGMYIPIS